MPPSHSAMQQVPHQVLVECAAGGLPHQHAEAVLVRQGLGEARHVAFRMFISGTGDGTEMDRLDRTEHWRPERAEAIWLCSGQAAGSRVDSTWSGPGEARWPRGGPVAAQACERSGGAKTSRESGETPLRHPPPEAEAAGEGVLVLHVLALGDVPVAAGVEGSLGWCRGRRVGGAAVDPSWGRGGSGGGRQLGVPQHNLVSAFSMVGRWEWPGWADLS